MATVAAAVSGILLATGGVAVAAPGNDTYPGRTVIGSVPFSETVDTSTATTDADDAEINSTCGAPATDASVWYEYTPPADGAIIVDTSRSSYPAGVLVATGGPGAWTVETCGPIGVALPTTAGVTYSILAFDFQGDGGGNGGLLQIDVVEAPPPPEIDITIDPTAAFNPQTGSATVRGTATCSSNALFALVQTELRQQIGRFTIIGDGVVEVTCDGATHPWSVEIRSENGKFSGGKAADASLAVACGEVFCGLDFEERQVLISRR